MDVTVVSALSALIGGVLLKIIEGFFADRSARRDDLVKFRGELQTELKNKNVEVTALRQAYDELEHKFFEVRNQLTRLETIHERCSRVEQDLKDQLEYCRQELERCRKEKF